MSSDTVYDVTIDDAAVGMMKDFMAKPEIQGKVVRLSIQGMGCGGPNFGLTIDELNDEEVIFKKDGLTVIADSLLRSEIIKQEGLKIRHVDHPTYGAGFEIKLNKVNTGGCSSGGCSCC